MQFINGTGNNVQCRRPQFSGKSANIIQNEILPKEVIDRFGINMKTSVKYKGEPDYMPAPDNIDPKLRDFFKRLQVNWNTHVDHLTRIN